MSRKPVDHPSVGTVVRADVTERVRALGFTRDAAVGHVDAVLDLVTETLVSGMPLKISGFGRFEVVEQKARMGRNPATGDSLALPARNTVAFRPAPALRTALTQALPYPENT